VVARADDIEAKLAEAKRDAARLKRAVTVYQSGVEAAIVWPSGQVDIQTDGALLISSRPLRKEVA
jgi:hypothetical protein